MSNKISTDEASTKSQSYITYKGKKFFMRTYLTLSFCLSAQQLSLQMHAGTIKKNQLLHFILCFYQMISTLNNVVKGI
jgi:predicted N-acyltransferase